MLDEYVITGINSLETRLYHLYPRAYLHFVNIWNPKSHSLEYHGHKGFLLCICEELDFDNEFLDTIIRVDTFDSKIINNLVKRLNEKKEHLEMLNYL